jgi:hypothetical protein
MVSAGVAPDHRGHHARRDHHKNPPASAACGGPTPHGPSSCSPRSLRVVLRLTSPGVSQTRPRSRGLVGAKSSSSGPRAVLRHASTPRASRCSPCAAPPVLEACSTPGCVCSSPSAETAFAIAFETVSRSGLSQRLPQPRSACCPSPGAGHDRRVSRPAACRSHCQPPGRWKMPFEFPILRRRVARPVAAGRGTSDKRRYVTGCPPLPIL